jgi:hypothetical protein
MIGHDQAYVDAGAGNRMNEWLEKRHELIDQLPLRFDLSYLAPDLLAPLFLIDLVTSASSHDFHDALAERLLDLTIRKAAVHSDFYAARYSGFAPLRSEDRITLQDLQDLPIVERKDIEQAEASIRSKWASYAYSTYTSGTTSGRPLIVDRSIQEQAYVNEFFSLLQSYAPDESEQPLVLVLETAWHGRTLEVPGPVFRFPVGVGLITGCRTAIALLDRTFQVEGGPRRISSIGGNLTSLLRFTSFVELEERQDLTQYITAIQSTAEYMTRRNRYRLTDFWGCPVEDRFGVSELLMGAWCCSHCGFYHFEPYGVPEVLDFATGRRIESGRGRLLLTSFYPFSQMTPLIRYATGDIAFVQPVDCPAGLVGYQFLGRISAGLDLSPELGAGQFLSEAEALEVLDPMPDVNRNKINRSLPEPLAEVGATPNFKLRRRADRLPELAVELRFEPGQFAERAAGLHAKLLSDIGQFCPFLAPLIGNGLFVLSFVGPGALNEANK